MKTPSTKELWWIVRILSSVLIVFSVLMFIGESSNASSSGPMRLSEIVGLSLAGIGLLGLALAWKWELIGGIIALVAFVAIGAMEPMLFAVPLVYVYPGTAALFILLWYQNREYLKRTTS